jgi:hypothetical protein
MVTSEESIPQYTDGYRYAQSAFFCQFNDVDFYVEDEGQENLYFCILKKLFPRIRFEHIHPLRGKQNTIAHAKANWSPRKSVYLLDKDFDDLLGRIHVQANVFYLDKFCIENFLVEEKAIIKFIIDEKPRLKSADVCGKFRFQSEWDEIINQLSRLFAYFFVVQKHNIALPSTGQAPDCFCLPTKCSLDSEKVSQYVKRLRKRASQQVIAVDLQNELAACSTAFELNRQTKLSGANVSGKFILFLFEHRITKSFGLNHVPNTESFAYRLAQGCDFRSLGALHERVSAYLSAK